MDFESKGWGFESPRARHCRHERKAPEHKALPFPLDISTSLA